ncbi:MAG: hypothetical protein AAF705_14630, partial [Bacteroidota bacterium]
MTEKIKSLVLILLFISSTSIMHAQNSPKEITDEFFKLYEQSPLKAVDFIFGTNRWMMERNKDGVENVKT